MQLRSLTNFDLGLETIIWISGVCEESDVHHIVRTLLSVNSLPERWWQYPQIFLVKIIIFSPHLQYFPMRLLCCVPPSRSSRAATVHLEDKIFSIVMMEISRWELLLEINYCCELRIVMDGWHCILAQILCGLLQTTDNLFAKLSWTLHCIINKCQVLTR